MGASSGVLGSVSGADVAFSIDTTSLQKYFYEQCGSIELSQDLKDALSQLVDGGSPLPPTQLLKLLLFTKQVRSESIHRELCTMPTTRRKVDSLEKLPHVLRDFFTALSKGQESEEGSYPIPGTNDCCEIHINDMECELPSNQSTLESFVTSCSTEVQDGRKSAEVGKSEDICVVINQITASRDSDSSESLSLKQIMNDALHAVSKSGVTLHSVNLSNCHFTSVDISTVGEPAPCPFSCYFLNLAANPLGTWRLCHSLQYCPSNLLVLDMSNCVGGCGDSEDDGNAQGLILGPACFLACPQLQRLVLDGCGLKATLVKAGEVNMSIFCGLVSLTELSLADNSFESNDDLLGGLLSVDSSAGVTVEMVGSLQGLKHLTVAENACTEISSDYKALKDILYQNFLCLETVDDHPRSTAYVGAVATSLADHLRTHQDEGNASNDLLLMNEKEFLTALKGEKDYTAVA